MGTLLGVRPIVPWMNAWFLWDQSRYKYTSSPHGPHGSRRSDGKVVIHENLRVDPPQKSSFCQSRNVTTHPWSTPQIITVANYERIPLQPVGKGFDVCSEGVLKKPIEKIWLSSQHRLSLHQKYWILLAAMSHLKLSLELAGGIS